MEVDRRPIRPEVLAALSQTPEVVGQMREVAKAIRRDARALAPRASGKLARNVDLERVFDKSRQQVSFIVGWTPRGWYGWLAEVGGEGHKNPRPHLVPAAIKNGAVAPRGVDL